MDQLVALFAQFRVLFGLPPLFLLNVAWIYRPGAKNGYQTDGNFPFYGDKKATKACPGGH